MNNILTNFIKPGMISLLLIVPFMVMEVVNRRNFNEGFPIPLFVVLWLLPVIFILTVMPLVRNLRRAGNSILANPVTLMIRILFLAFIIWVWFGIVMDQMSCFLGVPNCD